MNTPFYYWRSTLAPAERVAYDDMVAGFTAYRDPVSVKKVGPSAIKQLYGCILADHCELFYLTFSCAGVGSLFGGIDLLRPYIYSKEEISSRKSQLQALQKKIVTLCTGKSDEEKEKILIDYLLENVSYEINNKYNQNAATALTEGKGQCSGISRAFKLMCDWVGLRCISIWGTASDGLGGGGDHSWNIVYIDGKSYQVDVTFMIGANMKKIKPFNYLYYNYTDDEMKKNHYWDIATPPCTFLYKKNEKLFPSESSPAPRPTPSPELLLSTARKTAAADPLAVARAAARAETCDDDLDLLRFSR